MLTSATSARRTCSPPGRSMSRDSTSSTLRRTSGVPQTTTSKTFWSWKRLPDLDAGEHRGRGPPDVTRLDAERLRPVEVDLDLEGRLLDRQLHPRRLDPVDAGDQLDCISSAWAAQDVEVVPEHADGQVRALDAVGVADDVVDALLRIGRDHVPDTRVAVEHRFDRVHRRARSRRRGVDRDPQLAGVRADGLVTEDGPARVAADAVHAGQCAELGARAGRDPAHLRERRAGRGVQAHQEVAVLEVGNEGSVLVEHGSQREPQPEEHDDRDGGRGARTDRTVTGRARSGARAVR